MKKKIVAFMLVISMLAIALVGATMAYFTDDEVVTNTMTIGDVQINIEELIWNPETDEMANFVDDEYMLFPLDETLVEIPYNKIVYTYNTSESENDAYIRTLVAFENPEGLNVEYGLHFYCDDTVTYEYIEDVVIDGVNYYVVVFTQADGKAVAYDKYQATVNGVWMDKDITSETVKLFGEKAEILIFAQGIQASGLTHEQAMAALGELTPETVAELFENAEEGIINDWFTKYN